MTEEELNQTKDVMKKINENIDSAVKVIEEHKKLLKEKTKLERRIKILENKIENLQNVIKKAREYVDNDFNRFDCFGSMAVAMEMNHKREELLEILREANMPTFDEVEELFIEQREEGFNV